ncbi:MAG: ATP-binding protein [Ignavibacteria bacterium]|nr:ATP-binding protein [Ignavibacteria bacterium]
MSRSTVRVLLLLLICQIYLFAESEKIDSTNYSSTTDKERLTGIVTHASRYLHSSPWEGIKEAELGLSLARKCNDTYSEIDLLYYTAYYYHLLRDFSTAYEYITSASNLMVNSTDKYRKARIDILRARIEIILTKYQSALNLLADAVALGTGLHNNEIICDAHNYIGITHYILKDKEKAKGYIAKAFALSQEIGYQEGIALSNEHKGFLTLNDSLPEALTYITKALELRYQIGDRPGISDVLETVAVALQMNNKVPQAIDSLKAALAMRREMHSTKGVASIYSYLGLIYRKEKKYQSAIDNTLESIKIRKEIGDLRGVAFGYNILGNVYEELKDYKTALEYQKNYKELTDSIYNENSAAQASEILDKFNSEQHRKNLEHLEKAASLQKNLIIIAGIFAVLGLAFIGVVINRSLYRRKIQNELEQNHAAITEQNRQLIALHHQLTVVNQQHDRLFSIIAGDLKTPFSMLQDDTVALAENVDLLPRDQIMAKIRNIRIRSKHMLSLLDQLLLWAKLQRRKTDITATNIDLVMLMNRAIAYFEEVAEDKRILFRRTYPAHAVAYGSNNSVDSIFRNLISNAIKYSHAGGEISIVISENAGKFIISIADNGVGIEPAVLKHIFSLDITPTKGTDNEEGAGLGLYICKVLAEANNGSIAVESTLTHGSVFTLILPQPVTGV